MFCRNELPEDDFSFVVKPKFLKTNFYQNNQNYKANILIENQDLDLESQSQISLNIDNLILFNIGGLSIFEIASLERANKNKQFNINIIYGSNQIYNHKVYIKYIQEYFKGNSRIIKGNYYNMINNI